MSEAKVQLLAVLREATSPDYNRMRQAEEMLKQWENEPSFFATLQDIFYDRTVEHDVRFLSGIYLKNGIDRFWRRTAKNPISPEEKTAIRQRLLQFLDEPSKKVGSFKDTITFIADLFFFLLLKLTAQNAVIIARIARLDYPRDWPDLLSTLVQSIQTLQVNNEDYARLVHHRTLQVLGEVLSELSTRLLSAGRKQFAEIAPDVFQAVAQVYMVYVDRTLPKISQLSVNVDHESLLLELDLITTCIKCLRLLMVHGIRDVHKYNETRVMMTVVFILPLQIYLTYDRFFFDIDVYRNQS
ncbi:armadillo-type protein [Choanephora cucurbitarum]|nr:armadillo-type protein [Choanephora cucurbitarum]